MNIESVLSDAELLELTSKSDLNASWNIFVDYTIIIAAFAMMAKWPNPFVLLLGIFILGGRQLALAVIVHECGHRVLFNSPKLNDVVGQWLGGYLVFSDMGGYMKGHWQHHRLAGTEDDPDLKNYRDYPVARSRFRRKAWRDLSGQTGWRRLKSIGRALRNYHKLNTAQQQFLRRSIASNLAMALLLAAFGVSWLYLIWVIAFVTSHMFIVRVRQLAEHAAVPDLYDLDPRKNTRTLYANWIERLLFAPHHLNYHLEHHLLATIPIYHLKKTHQLLQEKGFYDNIHFTRGYFRVLKEVTVPG
jgi:fatty acid desaturase